MRLLNKNIIVLLMLISQVLLSVFIVLWLRSQYLEEYKLLSASLQRGYTEAERSMMDSVITIHLVDPIMNSKNLANVTLQVYPDSISQKCLSIKGGPNADDTASHVETIRIVSNKKVPAFFVNDSMLLDSVNKFNADYGVIEKGVNLFVEYALDLSSSDIPRATFYSKYSDSLLLRRNFLTFMDESGFDFFVYWNTPDSLEVSKPGVIKLKANRFLTQNEILISGYRFFLVRKISPQVLFALVLLIITTLAFRISYLSIRKQQRLLQLKNDLISNISHELKTPVATVKVALESLIDFDKVKDPEIVKEYLSMSVQELNRLENLVGKVLNNSILEAKQDVFLYEETDLKQVLEEVIAMQKYSLQASASIKFESSLPNAVAKLDKTHIQGVLLNLIDNSLKYGGEEVQITIKLSGDKSGFNLKVSDNGPGIPEEYASKVFDKFFRIPSNDRHNIKGYGLGLNYARLVVEQHQGKIHFTNLENGGCEFSIYLPIVNEEN